MRVMEKRVSLLLAAFSFFCVLPEPLRAQRVAWYEVPEAVQESFYLAHPVSSFRFIRWAWTPVGYCARYNFPFNEVSSIFQSNGEWVSTRWVIPESTLPLRAHDFISSKYAFYELRSCSYEEDRWQGRHYYALLSIKGIEGYMTEICFDLKGNVESIDGNYEKDWYEFEPLNEEEVLLMQENQDMVPEPSAGKEDGFHGEEGETLPIGFFAWNEAYHAMEQQKAQARALRLFEKQQRKLARVEQKMSDTGQDGRRWLARSEDYPEREAAQADAGSLARVDFEKEKKKRTQRLYRKQSRREFVQAQVLAQTKAARVQQMENESGELSSRGGGVSRMDSLQESPDLAFAEPAGTEGAEMENEGVSGRIAGPAGEGEASAAAGEKAGWDAEAGTEEVEAGAEAEAEDEVEAEVRTEVEAEAGDAGKRASTTGNHPEAGTEVDEVEVEVEEGGRSGRIEELSGTEGFLAGETEGAGSPEGFADLSGTEELAYGSEDDAAGEVAPEEEASLEVGKETVPRGGGKTGTASGTGTGKTDAGSVQPMERTGIALAKAPLKTIFPDRIQKAFDRRFPRAEGVKYYRDTNTNYRAVFTNFGQKAEAVFLDDGTHITTALFFGKKDMSYPVRQYIESLSGKPRFVSGKRVVYESRYRQRFPAARKPQNYYQVVVWVKDKETRSRKYHLLTFDHRAHFVSSKEYDYAGSR